MRVDAKLKPDDLAPEREAYSAPETHAMAGDRTTWQEHEAPPYGWDNRLPQPARKGSKFFSRPDPS